MLNLFEIIHCKGALAPSKGPRLTFKTVLVEMPSLAAISAHRRARSQSVTDALDLRRDGRPAEAAGRAKGAEKIGQRTLKGIRAQPRVGIGCTKPSELPLGDAHALTVPDVIGSAQPNQCMNPMTAHREKVRRPRITPT